MISRSSLLAEDQKKNEMEVERYEKQLMEVEDESKEIKISPAATLTRLPPI